MKETGQHEAFEKAIATAECHPATTSTKWVTSLLLFIVLAAIQSCILVIGPRQEVSVKVPW